jgi:hypothetical protein
MLTAEDMKPFFERWRISNAGESDFYTYIVDGFCIGVDAQQNIHVFHVHSIKQHEDGTKGDYIDWNFVNVKSNHCQCGMAIPKCFKLAAQLYKLGKI